MLEMPSKKRQRVSPDQYLPLLRALADATRLKLVRALAKGESAVTALADGQGLTMYNASRHLKVLKDAGLVEMEVSAQQRIYRLSPPIMEELKRNGNVLDLGCCSFRLDDFPV